MAYQVLARKWRPQLFAELVGQEHVATTLLNALRSERMPHALLFTGPRGVGKTSAARILAKSLRCQNAKDFVPCDKCVDCVEITQGRAIDVIEIDGASNNGVENIRELRETVGYMPSRGKYKIYIIDEVHMLSTSAFNALLKTLEEPPPSVIFIFATTEPQKIPVTILSRCQRFDFRRVPIRKVVEQLKVIVKAEGVTADSQSLWLIGRESEGSMRDSQSLLDQVITFCGNEITHQKVVDVLGLTDRTLLSNTLRALINRDASACLDIIQKVFHLGYDPKQFGQDLLMHLRSLMIVKVSSLRPDAPRAIGHSSTAGPDASLHQTGVEFLDLPDQEIDELKEHAQTLSEEDVHLLFDMTLKGVNDVMRAQDPRIVLEMLILRLSQAPRLIAIETLIKQLQGGTVALPKAAPKAVAPTPNPASRPVQAPQGRATQPAAVAPIAEAGPHSTAEAIARWPALIEDIKRDKPLLGAKLEYAAVQALENGKLAMAFKKEQEFFYNQVNTKECIQQLSELLGKYWGKAYAVEVNLALPGTMAPSMREEQDNRQKAQEDEIRAKVEANPLVKEAKSILKAKITSIKESS